MKEFEVGSLYKSKCAGIVVKCTKDKCDVFEGIVVDSNLYSSYENGYTSSRWLKNNFEEHLGLKDSTETTLKNGHKYNIPKGCKATVTGDVIEIEEDVRYFYHKNNGCTGYYKNMTDTTMEVAFYNDGDISISISTSDIFDWSERSTKEEFEEAYKEAVETLKP